MINLIFKSTLRIFICSIPILAISIYSVFTIKQPDFGKSVLRVVYVPFSSNLPFFVALESDYFNKYNVQIEQIPVKDSSQAFEYLKQDKADISIENNYSVIFSRLVENPNSVKLIQPCYEIRDSPISYLLSSKQSKIKNLKQLLNTKISTYSGESQFFVLKYLNLKGILGEVKELKNDINFDEQLFKLKLGEIDVLFTVEPYAAKAIIMDKANVIDEYVRGKILDPFPAGATSISTVSLKKNKKAIKNFIKAMDGAILEIENADKDINFILAKYISVEQNIAIRSNIYMYKTFEKTNNNKEILELKNNIKALSSLYQEVKIIDNSLSLRDIFLTEKDLE